jgi:hypothetical protein
LIFTPIIDLQRQQYPNHYQQDLSQGIYAISLHGAIGKLLLSEPSEKFDHL